MSLLRLLPFLLTLLLAAPALAQVPACATQSTAQIFLSTKLHLLQPGFDFDNNGGSGLDGTGPYSPPQFSTAAVPAPYVTAFRNMFQIAPLWVRQRLCTLDDVGIETPDAGQQTGAAAWTFWEVGNQGSRNYLVVSRTLLTLNPTLTQVETLTTSELLGTGSRRIFRIVPNKEGDGPAMGLLAVVAHELGHLMIARDAPASWNCGAWTYPWQTWKGAPAQRSRIRFFGHTNGNETFADSNMHSIAAIRALIDANDYAAAATALAGNARTANWAGVFAAVASDFDFTQTLSLLALSQARPWTTGSNQKLLTALAVYIGNPPPSTGTATIDLIKQMTTQNTGLWNKARCLMTHAPS